MRTSVILFIFNRPHTTLLVLNTIRKVKPSRMLIIADGPRFDSPDDRDKCLATRKIIDQVDWDCDLLKNYSDINLGLKERMSTGLDWAFSIVEEAIILEDDCLPDPSFFRFCDELLNQYRDDKRVFAITGSNILESWGVKDQSYHYSKYFNCWGWATWRQVWASYDVDMKQWAEPEVQDKIKKAINSNEQYLNRKRFFDKTYQGETKSWAYQFFFMCLLHSGLTVTPAVNLVSNVGFDKNATNTKASNSNLSTTPTKAMRFPLRHPKDVSASHEYDYQWYKKAWKRTPAKWVSWKIRGLCKRLGFYR